MSHINLLFHGIIVGIIIFQTSVIAPTVFKTINSEETSRFLRIIFPRFFIFIGALGAMSLLVELLYEKNISTISISVLTVLMAFLCYAIIPSTNSATDEGNQEKVQKITLHERFKYNDYFTIKYCNFFCCYLISIKLFFTNNDIRYTKS